MVWISPPCVTLPFKGISHRCVCPSIHKDTCLLCVWETLHNCYVSTISHYLHLFLLWSRIITRPWLVKSDGTFLIRSGMCMFLLRCSLVCILNFHVSVQPVVDAFDPRLLIAQPIIHNIDFLTAKVPICYLFLFCIVWLLGLIVCIVSLLHCCSVMNLNKETIEAFFTSEQAKLWISMLWVIYLYLLIEDQ